MVVVTAVILALLNNMGGTALCVALATMAAVASDISARDMVTRVVVDAASATACATAARVVIATTTSTRADTGAGDALGEC